ncbi:MAG: TldD/PmbA family protein [Candidatus Micrarchaeota archaeon]
MIDEGKLFSLAREFGCSLEFFSQVESSLVMSADNFSIHAKSGVKTGGFGVRTIKDGKLGFYSFEKESELKPAVKHSIMLSKLQEGANYAFPGTKGKSAKYFDKKARNFDSWAIPQLEDMLDVQKEAKVDAVQNIIGASMNEDLLVNSEGGLIEQEATSFFAVSQCAYGRAEGDYSESASKFNFDPSIVSKNAAMLAKSSANPRKIPVGKTDVIFSHNALHELLDLILPINFSGESLRKKLTKLGKGTDIASENISIIDDPSIPEGLKPSEYDDEGFATRKKFLVRNGSVEDFLFDMHTAAKMPNKPAAGNGYRNSFHFAPMISHSDTEITGGDSADIVSECKRGILVHSFLTSGANPVTGDFSFPFLIAHKLENGEKKLPVKDAMMKGNFFELMKTAEFERKTEMHNGLKAGRMGCELEVIS